MRKSISTAFFSMVSTLIVLGIVLMGCSEWVLFKNYFAKDRYETLDQVVNVAKRTAEYLVNSETMPQGAELDALNTKLEIIGESAEAYLFFTDRQGNVLIASDPEKLTTGTVPLDICQRANAVADPDARHYHAFGDLGGALTEKSYIAAVETIDDQSLFSGWLFLCSSGAQLTDFKQQFWSNFLMSACVMLLCASVLTRLLMRQLTDPLQKVTDAAQRFGGGDLSVRVEGVEGDGEVADLARTFNQMAENIQSNDNSRGQFMGNIAHELRTPMTTIKGFVDGILDGTIRFSVEKLGPEAEISIWNSGQGISPEALPYVFERFYKEDRSRGLHARGSGLGLNICKVLVNLAGGQIRVESQQGEWCRFVFTLPTCSPNPGGMKRLPDAAGQPGAVEDPASMKPVE